MILSKDIKGGHGWEGKVEIENKQQAYKDCSGLLLVPIISDIIRVSFVSEAGIVRKRVTYRKKCYTKIHQNQFAGMAFKAI